MKNEKKKTSFRSKMILLAVTASLLVVAAIVLPIVNYYVGLGSYTDTDGTEYTVKPDGDSFKICRSDGSVLPLTDDGYYYSDAGNLLEVGDDGYVSVYATVDAEAGEVSDSYSDQRVLMFEYVSPSENFASLEVHNEYGTYKFVKGSDGVISIDGFEGTAYDAQKTSALFVECGYTLALYRIDEETYEKYGDGEYGFDADSPYYIITTTAGKSYKVFVGDEIPSGEGYYVKLDGRNRVYILSDTIGGTVLQPVENFVTPRVFYPMSVSTYNDVSNFTVFKTRYEDDGSYAYNADGKVIQDEVVGFSYIDLTERTDTANEAVPFRMTAPSLAAYTPSADNVLAALRAIYETEYVGVKKLGVDMESREKYGLDVPEYSLYYIFKQTDGNGNTIKYKHNVYISKLTENGTYYVTSDVYASVNGSEYALLPFYDQIAEVSRNTLLFLDWDLSLWLEKNYDQIGIVYIDSLKLESPEYNADFKVKYYDGKRVKGGQYYVEAVDEAGTHILDDKSYGEDDSKTLLTWFKYFCVSRTRSTIVGSAEISDEEFETIRRDPKNLMLRMTITYVGAKDWSGKDVLTTSVFEFYRCNDLKSYISVNGNKPFMVLTERVEDMVDHAQKAVLGQTIVNNVLDN